MRLRVVKQSSALVHYSLVFLRANSLASCRRYLLDVFRKEVGLLQLRDEHLDSLPAMVEPPHQSSALGFRLDQGGLVV